MIPKADPPAVSFDLVQAAQNAVDFLRACEWNDYTSENDATDIAQRLEDGILAAETRRSPPWQDIATAPKDGTRVLLLWHDGVAAPFMKVGWNLGGGRVWQDTHEFLHNDRSWPTHWMELPAVPASQRAQEPPR